MGGDSNLGGDGRVRRLDTTWTVNYVMRNKGGGWGTGIDDRQSNNRCFLSGKIRTHLCEHMEIVRNNLMSLDVVDG